MSLSACAHDQLISFEQLPANAQAFVTTHFSAAEVSVVVMDKDLLDTDYEVRLQNGTKLEFEGNGDLKKVDCGYQRVPDAILPEPVKQCVAAKFPNSYVTEWKLDDWHWKAELNNGLELVFSRTYEFVGIDD